MTSDAINPMFSQHRHPVVFMASQPKKIMIILHGGVSNGGFAGWKQWDEVIFFQDYTLCWRPNMIWAVNVYYGKQPCSSWWWCGLGWIVLLHPWMDSVGVPMDGWCWCVHGQLMMVCLWTPACRSWARLLLKKSPNPWSAVLYCHQPSNGCNATKCWPKGGNIKSTTRDGKQLSSSVLFFQGLYAF